MNEEISKLPKAEADLVLELPNSYRERGREEGIKIGEFKSKKQLVLNMINRGLAYELIAEIAEMTVEEVTEIQKENDKSK